MVTLIAGSTVAQGVGARIGFGGRDDWDWRLIDYGHGGEFTFFADAITGDTATAIAGGTHLRFSNAGTSLAAEQYGVVHTVNRYSEQCS